MTDAEDSIEVFYENVYVVEPDDDWEDPPIIWALDFDEESQGTGGFELLSLLDIEGPVGLDEDMYLVIAGSVDSGGNEQNDWLTVTVVFETAGECSVEIVSDDIVD